MTAMLHPLPASCVNDLLTQATRALCDRPGETKAQGESRTRELVHAVLSFDPRDALEYSLAALIHGHFQLILDATRDLLLGESDTPKPRGIAGLVALDRAMLSLIKELRTQRERPVEEPAKPAAATAARPAAPPPVPQSPAPAPRPAPPPQREAARTDPVAPRPGPPTKTMLNSSTASISLAMPPLPGLARAAAALRPHGPNASVSRAP